MPRRGDYCLLIFFGPARFEGGEFVRKIAQKAGEKALAVFVLVNRVVRERLVLVLEKPRQKFEFGRRENTVAFLDFDFIRF